MSSIFSSPKKLFTSVIIAAVMIGALITFANRSKPLTPEEQKLVLKDERSHLEFRQAAWLPDWAGQKGLESLEANGDILTTVSPVWYEVNKDGSLIDKSKNQRLKVTEISNNKGMELIPAVAMFDHELFTEVLQNEENYSRHVAAILAEVEKFSYDGIDLDYESTKLSDKEKYIQLLKDLKAGLQSRKKKLVVSVLAQWDNNTGYKSLKETRKAQDYGELGKIADEIRIMTYDYTYTNTLFPGPIAPLKWMREVLDYAVKHIPKEKIVLGVHLYSYEWWVENSALLELRKSPNFIDPLTFVEDADLNLPLNPRATRSYTYDTTKTILEGELISDKRYEGERVIRFQRENPQTKKIEERVLVFIDPEGIKARRDLAKDYGIRGVSFWRLGGEAELLK